MRLEKIEPVGDDRFRLLFEGGGSLSCGPAELVDFGLRSGLDLDEAAYEKLEAACVYYLVRLRAAALAAGRAMSGGELRRKLTEKGASEQDAQRAADWLTELGVLDEAAYARMVVRHYAAKGYGRRRVENELYRHMVPRDLWQAALAALPDPADSLDALVAARLRGRTADPDTLRRLAASLCRRGYAWEAVRAAIRRHGGDEQNIED